MTKLLAVLDPEDDKHLALQRCAELPPDSDLEIHVALFIKNEGADSFANTFNMKKDWLNCQVEEYVEAGYRITTEVVPFSNLYEAVIDAADRADVDFVIKPMRQHSLFSTMVRTSTDWKLIRHCARPLLLVSHLDTTHAKPVLAALDVCSGDEKHDQLNERVLYQAQRIARTLGSDTVIVNAYRTTVPAMAVGAIDTVPLPTPKELVDERRAAIDDVLAASSLETDQIHVEEGSPPVVINDTARRIGAGVVVIGTVARTGIGATLIGNTAEGVLEGSSVDVMIVKLGEDG